MKYKISDECIACGRCFAKCPVKAVYEGNGKYEIDKGVCIGCGKCAANCPISAISEEE